MDIIEIGQLIAHDRLKLSKDDARQFKKAYHRLRRDMERCGDMGLGALLLVASQECAKYGK